MKVIYRLFAVLLLTLVLFGHGRAETKGDGKMRGQGIFSVRTVAQEGSPLEKSAGIVRVGFEKEWSGTLTGTSQCEMLSSVIEPTHAMAYVALERFVGKVNGLSGSFYFSHVATMQKDDPDSGAMKVVVVKNSGTEELRGLSGELAIRITEGKHSYDFNYELPGH